jgi:sec-independent protein translocase protein TatA
MGLDNPLHIAFLLVILLLVFGARRLPEIGRSLGSGLREFKQSINGESHGNDHERPTLNAGAPQTPVQQVQQVQTPVQQTQPSVQQAQPPAPAPVAQPDPAPTDQR